MPLFGPMPQLGRPGQVVLDGKPLRLIPGTYQSKDAEPFIQRISNTALGYSDFNPYRQAWEMSSLSGGYGLQRYSDLPVDDPTRRRRYKQAIDVDCRDSGLITLGPLLQVSSTAITGTPLFIGEFTPSSGPLSGVQQVVVITSDGMLYTCDSSLVLTLRATLPSPPVGAAIGTFNGHLIIGYGAVRTAQYTDDLITLGNVANGTPANIYVWAFTADQAAAFVAGGPLATDWDKVTSGTTGIDGYSIGTNVVPCGDPASKITGLAPGGGIVQLFVGKEDELGEIDNDALSRTLVPFDTSFDTNCQGLRWWLGSDTQEQRGPVVLFFPRERALWSYQPKTDGSGSAKNMSPWSEDGIRPKEIIGRPTALQGTARWLYYVVSNISSGTYYLLVQDARTGVTHSLTDLKTRQCQALSVVNMFGTPPLLLLGYGNALAAMTLPLDGDSPTETDGYLYAYVGTLDISDIDYDFPDIQKIATSLRVISDDLLPAVRYIDASFAVDDDIDAEVFTNLGTIASSPEELTFPAATTFRRLAIRVVLHTDSSLSTPRIRAMVLRAGLNPETFRLWQFSVAIPAGTSAARTVDLQNVETMIREFWDAKKLSLPVGYTDRHARGWTVRILDMAEEEILREPDRVLETKLSFQLLQVSRVADGTTFYNAPLSIYNLVTTRYS